MGVLSAEERAAISPVVKAVAGVELESLAEDGAKAEAL